jgi:hypothetical protein
MKQFTTLFDGSCDHFYTKRAYRYKKQASVGKRFQTNGRATLTPSENQVILAYKNLLKNRSHQGRSGG